MGPDGDGPIDHDAGLAAPGPQVVLSLLGVVLLVLVVQSAIAYLALQDARRAQGFLVTDIAKGDLPAAQDHARLLAADTGRARLGVWGPWWALPRSGAVVRRRRPRSPAHGPGPGRRGQQGRPPLIQSSAQIEDGLSRPDGSVDVAVLDRLTTVLATASQHADDATERMATINAAGLTPPLRDVVLETRGDVDRLAKTVHGVQDGLVLARALVGAQEPRVTLARRAEPCGEPGNRRDHRRLGSARRARRAKSPSARPGSTTSSSRSDRRWPTSPRTSSTPTARTCSMCGTRTPARDFPVGARLLADGYRRYARTGAAPALPSDATVLTVTPRALGRILTVTGPVAVQGYSAPINGDNAASLFTNGVYSLFPREAARVAFIHDVLTEVFTRLQRQDTDPVQLVDELRGMASDRELMAWSPDPRIEAAITGLGISGALTRPGGASALVTLVNSDASKLDFYLRAAIALRPAGKGSASLAISLTNTAPSTIADYVGNHDPRTDLPETTHDVVVQLRLPPSVGIARVLLDGRPTGVSRGTESGWTVVRRLVRLARGDSATLSVTLDGDARAITTVVPPVMTSPAQVTVRGTDRGRGRAVRDPLVTVRGP